MKLPEALSKLTPEERSKLTYAELATLYAGLEPGSPIIPKYLPPVTPEQAAVLAAAVAPELPWIPVDPEGLREFNEFLAAICAKPASATPTTPSEE